jgi:sugar lactone lactonase YvrE
MAQMSAAPTVTDLRAVGRGIQRPEQAVVGRDGRVYASDQASLVAEIVGDDEIRHVGATSGEPNGIAMTARGTVVIPQWGHGLLQELDLTTGQIITILDGHVDGRSVKWLNAAAIDSTGAIWCSVSTLADDFMETMVSGASDGLIIRVAPDHTSARVVADGVFFPNCMAMDHDERHLYVVRTIAADLVRFPIIGDSLGAQEPFSPALGGRRADEFGDVAIAGLSDPAVLRRWGFADGCALDAHGNVWVTLVFLNRIVAVAPNGDVSIVVEDPDGALLVAPTSVAFGGADLRDVYFGSLSAPYVIRGRSTVPGMTMAHLR